MKSGPELLLNKANNNHMSIDTQSHSDNYQRTISNGESPIVLTRSVSAATRDLPVDKQLIAKGKILLGKYYNGPDHMHNTKTKGKQTSKK